MCGIAGHVGTGPVDPARVEATLARMCQRGPDGQRSVRVGSGPTTTTLLHSRLSIIDLDPRSDQPFVADGCTLVFNGELYNHVEVRAELERRGVRFTTGSDTEVVLRAYVADGIAAFDGFEGMWALALHDGRDGSVLLARDRFAEKPLHWLEDASGFWFASETAMLASLTGRRLEVDLDHLTRFVARGHKALYRGDGGLHLGVHELPPAGVLRIAPDGSRTASRIWTPRFAPDKTMTFDAAVEGVREHLVASVRLRLRADVPLAFCLSGGVDSASLVSIAAKVLGADVSTFSIVDVDPRYDERELIRATVDDVGSRHTEVVLRPDGHNLERLRALVAYHDAPVATISYLVHSMLSEAIAASGHRVAISGTGADELLTGYYDHLLLHLAEVHGTPDHAPALAAWREHALPRVRNPRLRDPDLFVRDPGSRAHVDLDEEEFGPYLRVPLDAPFTEVDYAPGSPLRTRMMNELFHEIVRVILHEDDLNSMMVSVENRSPYLDRRLFEFAATIPSRHLVRDGYAKAVLREAVRGILNDRVRLEREKRGFNADITSLFDLTDPVQRAAFLDDSPLFERFDRGRIAALLDVGSYTNEQKRFLFGFLSARLFLEHAGA